MKSHYFRHLNYTLGDEDSRLEFGILEPEAGHVMAVAGSGGRVLPLLARHPRHLTCVDISQPQLFLTELRVEAVRSLEREEFLGFLGYPGHVIRPEERRQLLGRLALSLDAARFFEELFGSIDWQPLLYLGRFERTLRVISRVNGLLTGAAGRGLFEAESMEEQLAYLQSRFPRRAWCAVLRLMGNATVLNSLLYKGEFPRKNIARSTYDIYRDLFDRLFTHGCARESFFLQMVFFGELRFAEGLPVECAPEVFSAAKRALQHTSVSYVTGDIIEAAREAKDVDFLSLSDVPSFLDDERARSFLQALSPGLNPQAVIVTRGHLRISHPEPTGYEVVSERYAPLVSAEKTQLWNVNVYRKSGQPRASTWRS